MDRDRIKKKRFFLRKMKKAPKNIVVVIKYLMSLTKTNVVRLNDIEVIRGKHNGEAVFIVGTGPSLSTYPDAFLDDKISMTLPLAFLRTVKYNGLKRACKSLLRKLLFDGTYYDSLESVAGKPLCDCFSRINFIVADPHAESYPLPSNSFDLIASNAVIEHVHNVSRFAAEIGRLLRGGVLLRYHS